MFTYKQSTGELFHSGKEDALPVGKGYSGHGAGKNNPALQAEHNVGPIPQGVWNIGSIHDSTSGKGPKVMNLTPRVGTETFGRTDFMIHGDNAKGDASQGCIILGKALREVIAETGDTKLLVIA